MVFAFCDIQAIFHGKFLGSSNGHLLLGELEILIGGVDKAFFDVSVKTGGD
jgi:hypothetical protein